MRADAYSGSNQAAWLTFAVEPRYYYNLSRRAKKKKDIANNTGNYFSLLCGLSPGDFSDDFYLPKHMYFIPSYGLRRNFTNNFNFEAAFGVGFGQILQDNPDANLNITAMNLRLAIGYTF